MGLQADMEVHESSIDTILPVWKEQTYYYMFLCIFIIILSV